ncbi:hypothetical protein Tco_1252982 [Tanacetum coccineum]
MASLKYCDKHNQVGFLKKPEESAGFAEIVDFLKGSQIRYAFTHNPTIHDSLVKQFWQTATASTLADGTLELRATIDTLEYIITEVFVRSKLQLADASGIFMLPNTEIFEGMGNMGTSEKVSKKKPDEWFTTDSKIAAKKFFKQGRNSNKKMNKVFETFKQGNLQEKSDICPQALEAAETLAKPLVQIKTKRRNCLKTGFSSGGEHVNDRQREGNAVLEETPQTKEQRNKSEEKQASLAEIAEYKLMEESLSAKLKEKNDLVEGERLHEKDVSEADYAQIMKGLQKKPESAKSGTEEDVEAYMEERVDEPSSEEFPMSSIPQGPAPVKIVKLQIIKTGKKRCLSDHQGR